MESENALHAPRGTGAASDLSSWLVESFIPGWVARAWNPALPGYVENVSRRDGTALESMTHATMVTGRLVYTFSLGHVIGAAAPCLEAATHGLDVLLGPCRRSDGGFVHTLRADGAVTEPRADLYDIAFVLLALAGYAAATGRRDVLDVAASIGSALDRNADPRGGYREEGERAGLRLQYPQMHLFEAFQLLARLDPGRGWEERADAIVDLAEHRLIRPEGCINEWYDAEWQPAGSDPERELGHQFEWSWLLYRYGWSFQRPRATELANRLYAFGKAALRSAVGDVIGPLPNGIDTAGKPREATRPLWPLTELLRAASLAGIERPSGEDAIIADAALSAIFAHYIDRASGLWINALEPPEDTSSRAVPVRVLYHIVPALITYAREREKAAFEIHNPILDSYRSERRS